MPGGEIQDRWFGDPKEFATKEKCEKDMGRALAVVKAAQEKLALDAGFVHGGSHPGNVRSRNRPWMLH